MLSQAIDIHIGGQVESLASRDLLLAEGVNQRLSQAGDIHAGSSREIRDGPGNLSRTGGIDTANIRRSLFLLQLLSADRAELRSLKDSFWLLHTAVQLRNDLSGLEELVMAANPDFHLSDIVLIVQSRPGDGCSAESGGSARLYVMKLSRKGQLPRSPHIDQDLVHLYHSLLRGILIGDVSRGVFGPGRKILSVGNLVNFDNRSVDVIAQLIAHLPDLLDGGDDLFGIVRPLVIGHGKPHGRKAIQVVQLTPHEMGLSVLDIEDKESQAPLGGNPGIQLAKCPSRKIPWIGRKGLFILLLSGIIGLEPVPGHIDLPPQLQIGIRDRKLVRHLGDCPGILRDVFSDMTVSAGLSQLQSALSVAKSHGESVYLLLYGEYRVWMHLLHLFDPVDHRLKIKDILNGEHRHIVLYLDTCLPLRRPSNLLAGRIWPDPVGMLGLRRLQLLHQPVVLVV